MYNQFDWRLNKLPRHDGKDVNALQSWRNELEDCCTEIIIGKEFDFDWESSLINYTVGIFRLNNRLRKLYVS